MASPTPRPKSPPELYGKRRELAKVVMLEREIGFLQEELKSIETLQPASSCIKEVADYVVANPEPLTTTCRKSGKSCRFWKWLCGSSCFNMSWPCSCCCCCSLQTPRCCHACSMPHTCCCCSLPKCSCACRPHCPRCLKSCFTCSSTCCPDSTCFKCSLPSSCCWKCSCPKLPNCTTCFTPKCCSLCCC